MYNISVSNIYPKNNFYGGMSMRKLNTIFEFAFGKDCNYGRIINPYYITTTLDFTKDVDGYGFAIRDGIDCNLKKVNGIVHYIMTNQDLNGFIEYKTEASNGTPEMCQEIYLSVHGVYHPIHKFSSPLKEIVLYFPKECNKSFPIIDMEIYRIDLV